MQLPLACAHCNVRLLATNRYAIRRSCDQHTVSRVSVVFQSPPANAQLVHTLRVSPRASGAAQYVDIKIWPKYSTHSKPPSLSLLLHSQNSPIPITLTPSLPIPYLVSNVPLAGRVGTVGTCRATKCCHFPCHTSTEQHKHLCTDRTVLLAAFYDIAETRHLRQLCELT